MNLADAVIGNATDYTDYTISGTLEEKSPRPFVVSLRDWLACIALVLASVLMAATIYVGIAVLVALPDEGDVGDAPAVEQIDPDPFGEDLPLDPN